MKTNSHEMCLRAARRKDAAAPPAWPLRHALIKRLWLVGIASWIAAVPVRTDGAAVIPPPPGIDACNVVWSTPGKSSADSMPMGNGELGINLWVEEDGSIRFYLGRNDTHSETGQLCKAGEVRISLSPNPFKPGNPFRQELKLFDGVCLISAGDGPNKVTIKIFVDSAKPVVHVSGESAKPVGITVKIESWRTQKQHPHDMVTWHSMQRAPMDLWQAPDVFPPTRPESIAWYHRNETSPAFESSIKLQSLEPIRQTLSDPLIRRTFGGWITGTGLKSTDSRTLATPSPVTSFDIRVASPCAQTKTADEWLTIAEKSAAESADSNAALARTLAAWHEFWNRSWVDCQVAPAVEMVNNLRPPTLGPARKNPTADLAVGAVTITGHPMSQDEILARSKESPKTEPFPEVAVPDLAGGVTIEAWIKADPGAGGRILDNRTRGVNDGLFLETFGNQSIIMLIGRQRIEAPVGSYSPGKWVHLAGTCDPKTGQIAFYVNGRPAAKKGSETMTVGKAYTWQRYVQACAGRGLYPIKFNGSIFTVDPAPMGKNENPDWRRWGEVFWWQNTRIPVHNMLASGDFDLMMPLFNMYEGMRPFAEARAKLYFGAEGCFFPETCTFWGAYSNYDYGWKRDGKQPGEVECEWWRYAWNQGPELVSLMLDRYDFTADEIFLKSRLLPMATSVLKYFDTRFRKDDNGRIIIDPAQVIETYWLDVINDTPTVAGLIDITNRLCSLPPSALNADQRKFFEHMKAAAPVLPTESAKLKGQDVVRISMAQKFKPQARNNENPELYAVWPFRLFGLERPMLEIARNTYALRRSPYDVGWGYDGNVAALLGLTDEAARILKIRISDANGLYRWPATWGPNNDWLPDADHGGNMMSMVNYMLLQHAGSKILLLPAWPKNWDVSFKLHAPRKTTVEAVVRGGKVVHLKITPSSRSKDVVLCEPFTYENLQPQ